jgi:Protein of unknown function (DUF2608)
MNEILAKARPGSLLILDIDDTVGRVSQNLGLDAWFRFRIQQFANEGHSDSMALAKAVTLYNLAQMASTNMVSVDESVNIAQKIETLKAMGVKVIALTARNHHLADKTKSLLDTIGVTFSGDVLEEGEFMQNGEPVVIQNGIIFANGNNKGDCLNLAQKNNHFIEDLSSYERVHFVDDSEKNCIAVAKSLASLSCDNITVTHYDYAKKYLPFDDVAQKISHIQERQLLKNGLLLSDKQAQKSLSTSLLTP